MRRGRDGVRGFGRARGRRCRAARQTGVGSALLLAAVVGLLALAAAASSYVTTPSTIYTIAGNGVQCPTGTDACGDGGIATAAQVFDPLGVALDAVGDLYIADVGDNRIREVTPEGVISTIAGNGHLCAASPDTCGDGESANGPDAELAGPVGVAVGSDGVYIADEDGNAIRFIPSSSGTLYGMSVTAGDIYTISTTPAGRPGAILNDPLAVAVDASGDVYIANTDDDTVLKVTPGDVVSTIAGGGVACPSSTDPCGDGGAATSANLNHPAALALDSAGDVYLADSGDNRIRFIPATGGTFYGQSGLSAGDIYTIAGTGTACSVSPCGDGGSPTSADLSDPTGVAVDNAGNVYIADLADYTVRELHARQRDLDDRRRWHGLCDRGRWLRRRGGGDERRAGPVCARGGRRREQHLRLRRQCRARALDHRAAGRTAGSSRTARRERLAGSGRTARRERLAGTARRCGTDHHRHRPDLG